MPKSKEIENIFDRLVKNGATELKPRLALDISRCKKIRYLREKNNIFIGLDRIKHKSIIYLPPSIKVLKKGKKFFFEY